MTQGRSQVLPFQIHIRVALGQVCVRVIHFLCQHISTSVNPQVVIGLLYSTLLKWIGFGLVILSPSTWWQPPFSLVSRTLHCPTQAPGRSWVSASVV